MKNILLNVIFYHQYYMKNRTKQKNKIEVLKWIKVWKPNRVKKLTSLAYDMDSITCLITSIGK